MTKFEISPEFKMFQQQTATAFKEAGEAEVGAGRFIDLPLGSRGTCKFVGAIADKGQPKVANGQPIPGKPFIRMEVELETPESHRGRKYPCYFDLTHHDKYSQQQKTQDWWDFMQNAGCPRPVRETADPAQGFNWAQTAPAFPFMVVDSGYQNRGKIEPVPPMGPMPTASATEAAMAAAAQVQLPVPGAVPAPAIAPPPGAAPAPNPGVLQPGQEVMAFGGKYQVKSVEGNTCTLTNATGVMLPGVPLAQVQPAQ